MALTATDLFNDATKRETGGIGPDQINLIVSDLVGMQQQLSEEIAILENLNSPLDTPVPGTDLGQYVGQMAPTVENNDIAELLQQIQNVVAAAHTAAVPHNAAVVDDDDAPVAAHGADAAQAAAVTHNAAVDDDDAPLAAHGADAAATHAAAVSDIAALLQALQSNNSNAVSPAETALDDDMHTVSVADPGTNSPFADHYFEHMWG